jgi:hypothetical protein
VRIAVVAGESQVFAVVCSATLASNDVLDVISEERRRVLRKVAVFAAMIGTFTDGLPKPARPSGGMAFSQEPTTGIAAAASLAEETASFLSSYSPGYV